MSCILIGLRVVEIAGIGPGPFCAMHLADLGADVIVIDRPVGSDPEAPDRSGSILNRGKRSVVLDLKSAADRDQALRLIDQADVLIEGMRPGVTERLGLGPQDCRARNPRLVYGRMTGWGQTGPLAMAAGHDTNYLAVSGALFHAGTPDRPPSTPFAVLGDIGGGALYLMIGLLAGVLRARQSGQGCVVDAAVVDGSAHMLQLQLATAQRGLMTERRSGNIHDSSPFYATYRCADGEFITIGAIEPRFYRLLLEKLDLADDPAFQPQWDRSQWLERKQRLGDLFATRSRQAWCALLEGSDVCFGPVLSPAEAARHPHNRARDTWYERDGVLQTRPAPRFDLPGHDPGPVPGLGAHTEAILSALNGGDPANVWL